MVGSILLRNGWELLYSSLGHVTGGDIDRGSEMDFIDSGLYGAKKMCRTQVPEVLLFTVGMQAVAINDYKAFLDRSNSN